MIYVLCLVVHAVKIAVAMSVETCTPEFVCKCR